MASGNFGGGREGAMMGQYNADSLADRSALQASNVTTRISVKHNKQLIKTLLINKGYLLCKTNKTLLNQGLAGAYGNQMNQQFGLSDFGRQWHGSRY